MIEKDPACAVACDPRPHRAAAVNRLTVNRTNQHI
jgi:hypothetical protein